MRNRITATILGGTILLTLLIGTDSCMHHPGPKEVDMIALCYPGYIVEAFHKGYLERINKSPIPKINVFTGEDLLCPAIDITPEGQQQYDASQEAWTKRHALDRKPENL